VGGVWVRGGDRRFRALGRVLFYIFLLFLHDVTLFKSSPLYFYTRCFVTSFCFFLSSKLQSDLFPRSYGAPFEEASPLSSHPQEFLMGPCLIFSRIFDLQYRFPLPVSIFFLYFLYCF